MTSARRRHNPMPLSGAIFVTNGKRRNKGARRASALGRIVARFRNGRFSKRRNGLAVRTNRGHKRRTNRRRNGLAVRTNRGHKRRRNGLAVRTNRGHKRRTNRRRNGLAVRTNRGGKRRHNRRRNGLAVRTNRRRNSGRRRNPTMAIFRPVTSLLGKIPGGKMIAPYVAPALLGALGLYGIHFALKMGGKYIPVQIRAYVAPFGYTLGGILLGALVQYVPFGSASDRKALAAAMVVGGAGVDAYRKVTGSSALGDDLGEGGLWQLGGDMDGDHTIPGYGDSVALYGDMDEAELQGDYSDAEMGDAIFAGPDLDSIEGEAALAGPRAWRRKFGKPDKKAAGPRGKCSKHAGKHGHRWAWLCKLIGFKKFQAVVALPAEQRKAYLAQLKAHALSSLPQGGAGKAIGEGGDGSAGLADLGTTLYGNVYGAMTAGAMY